MKWFIWIATIIFVSIGTKAQNIVRQDSAKVRYLAEQKKLGNAFADSFYPSYVQHHRLSEKSFTAKIDSASKNFNALVSRYAKTLPAAYTKNQRFEIKMYFDKILVEYPSNHESYTTDRPKNYPLIEKKIKANLVLFNDTALLGSTDLMPFIQSFLNYKINAELNRPEYEGLYNKRLQAMWNLLPKYISNQRCRSYHQYHLLLDQISHNGFKYTETFYQEFKKTCRDTAFIAKLEQSYKDARNDLKDHKVVEYKKIGNYGLDLHLFENNTTPASGKKPVIVFFHGGSWSEGQAAWHFQACRKYAAQGWIACSVEYRIYGSQGTLPFAAVMDARSAIRWIREHGTQLNMDTARIVATGNSAGGHLVLASALAAGWNEKTDNLQYNPIPNVLLVNSGVYDLSDEKTAWIRKDLEDKNLVLGISPNALIKNNLPPTLLIHSKADHNVPYPSAEKFAALAKAAGNLVTFKTIEEGGHFIFDHPAYTPQVFAWRKEFLKSLGYPDSDGE